MMNHKIPDLYSEAILADIIETCAEGTYVGKYDRAKYDPSIDVHAQPIWRIRFFENVENVGENSAVLRRTRILYPDSRSNFKFVWDNRKNYTYKYSL